MEGFMKKSSIIVFGFLISFFIFSCASSPTAKQPTVENPYRPLSNMSNVVVIGTISIPGDTSFYFWQGTDISTINISVYMHLLGIAKKQYGDENIDLADIVWWRRDPNHNSISGNTIIANAKVIRLSSSSSGGIEGALERAADQALKNVPQRSKIAIVYITAQDKSTTEFIAGELEFIWVNKGYTIIDRNQLDRIRREQNFQMSGEVDEATAVSIGKFVGADVIVTGRIDGEGNLRRLRLTALNTQTAQVVGSASERL
jgi:hypothetical protein